jgi:hypothetical protein
MPDDGLKIVEEERVPLKDKSWYEDNALNRHLKRVFVYTAVCVLAAGLPFMAYLTMYGTPSQEAWTSHMLTAIIGAAAGTLWTTMHPK